MHDLQIYKHVFDDITPWSGHVPQGYAVNFLGVITDSEYSVLSGRDRSSTGHYHAATGLPQFGRDDTGVQWFDAVNWLSATRAARERFVMISLGAHYGGQLVSAHHMLQRINPMPSTLVAVEPEPGNFAWISRHMSDNGINPDAHWLVPMAASDSHEPVLFPVGASGVGSNNCFGTNNANSRRIYADLIIRDGNPEAALRSLLVDNTTSFTEPVHPGLPYMTEIRLVSAVTLEDLLGPFDRVDFIEADIQQSEIVVFPPFIDLLRKKVRRIHIGTHGNDVHASLHDLFAEKGWDIVFSFEPNATHECALGRVELNDGVLTVSNPDF